MHDCFDEVRPSEVARAATRHVLTAGREAEAAFNRCLQAEVRRPQRTKTASRASSNR